VREVHILGGMDLSRIIARALTLTPVRAFLRYSERRGPMLADSVTYRTLFSLFAAVLLGFSIAALWLSGDTDAWRALVAAVDRAVPGLVGENGLVKVDEISLPVGLSIAGALARGSRRCRDRCDRVAADGDAHRVRQTHRRRSRVARPAAQPCAGRRRGAALLASAAVTMIGTAGLDVVAQWLGLAREDPAIAWGTRWLAILVTFVLDAVVVAVLFRVLSGVRASATALWTGALIGAVGLTVLQQLSGLFVGGATSNPLLASFASLIALLLWVNLSAQVILISTSYIFTVAEEQDDRACALRVGDLPPASGADGGERRRARHGRARAARRAERGERALRRLVAGGCNDQVRAS
jgi:membrane protein